MGDESLKVGVLAYQRWEQDKELIQHRIQELKREEVLCTVKMVEWQGGLEEADGYNRINSAMDVKDGTWESREKSA